MIWTGLKFCILLGEQRKYQALCYLLYPERTRDHKELYLQGSTAITIFVNLPIIIASGTARVNAFTNRWTRVSRAKCANLTSARSKVINALSIENPLLHHSKHFALKHGRYGIWDHVSSFLERQLAACTIDQIIHNLNIHWSLPDPRHFQAFT